MRASPKRKHIRLDGYDYSQNGAYFITICSYKRAHIFGEITVGQVPCSCLLSNIGAIIDNEIKLLEMQYKGTRMTKYVIMPNHIHMIISIGAEGQEQSPCPTVGDIVCTLKSRTTKLVNLYDDKKGRKIWQYRYHDHIIRNNEDYQLIWNYIDTNPQRWNKDCYYG